MSTTKKVTFFDGFESEIEPFGEDVTNAQGPQGETGLAGPTGPAGGPVGATGLPGPTGFRGETGVRGVTGPQGIDGFIGYDGVTGIQGATGAGIQGATGLNGPTGPAGAPQGETGLQGGQGNTGIQGQTGALGNTGVQGWTGARGPTGLIGPSITGPQGPAGVLASEYGLANWIAGTSLSEKNRTIENSNWTNIGFKKDPDAVDFIYGSNSNFSFIEGADGDWYVNSAIPGDAEIVVTFDVQYDVTNVDPENVEDSWGEVLFGIATNFPASPDPDPSLIHSINFQHTLETANPTWHKVVIRKYFLLSPSVGIGIGARLSGYTYVEGLRLKLRNLQISVTMIAGPQGARGVTGFRGVTGPGVGEQGTTGARGVTGPGVGEQGVTGLQGPTGIIGFAGPAGVQGSTGFGLQGQTGIGAQGVTGSQGIQGETGLGVQGQTGMGVQGPAGSQGPQGYQGETGTIGPAGVTGPGYGVTGLMGPTGFRGETGAQGNTGAGIQGVTGSQGIQGNTGARGTTGAGIQGATGADLGPNYIGATGTQGINGVTGIQGVTGLGITGTRGPTGPSGGPIGATGVPGLVATQMSGCLIKATFGTTSASGYAWTVPSSFYYPGQFTNDSQNVFGHTIDTDGKITRGASTLGPVVYTVHVTIGTYWSAWTEASQALLTNGVNLLKNGTTISQNSQPITMAGVTTTSTTVFQVELAYLDYIQFAVYSPNDLSGSGTSNIFFDVTIIPLTGAEGPQGPAGSQGPTGLRGPTGIIGNTGLAGPTGPAGAPQGVTGADGLRGLTGALGQTGVQGPTGLRGVTGALGNTGPAGTNGTNGTNGSQGQTGVQGETGFQGVTGPGITGPAGAPQGVTGLAGIQGATGVGGGGGGSAYITTNRQTSSYTLVLGDDGKLVEMNVASANNLTVPPNSSVAYTTGTKIEITQYGAGQTTLVAGSGVTIRSANSWLKVGTRYGAVTLVKIATDEWYAFGNLIA